MTGTRAYLNILVFDENLTFVDGAFVPVTTAAMENGTNVPHEKLSGEIVVQQPGYVYIYLSNDNEQPLEVFFDDFTVEHVHSAIVQADDYYPFGLTFNSSLRENSLSNKYLFNGKEREGLIGWDYFGFRNYDPTLGRWHSVDPVASLAEDLSPYRFAFNNPIRYIDFLGLWEVTNVGYTTDNQEDIERFLNYLQAEKAVSGKDASISQMGNFIDGEMWDGLGTLSDGSRLLTGVDFYRESNSWKADQSTVDRTWHEVQGFLTPDALDPRTIKRNIRGMTYPGGDNPRTYRGSYDYTYAPSNIEEYPAIGHDRRYDNLKIEGLSGLLKDPRAIGADWKFVKEEMSIALTPGFTPGTRFRAGVMGLFLGAAATPKTLLKLAQPGGFAEVQMWYNISNDWVNNAPTLSSEP